MADVIAKTDMDSAHGRRMLKEIRDMWDEWDLQEDADHTVENICSVRQERGCSQMEKLGGKLFFERENFPFPRLDSCLAERR